MLLVDTPGIMLPKLKPSLFAYRAALAGLVQEERVPLTSLFAHTLYVLAHEPNRGQLKLALSRKIAASEASGEPQSSRRSASKFVKQGDVRTAYACKRVAKCILRAFSDTVDTYDWTRPGESAKKRFFYVV
jgi:hypothetical protein